MNPNSHIYSQKEVDDFLIELRTILSSTDYELDIVPRKKGEDPLDPFTTENTMIDLDYDSEDVKNELIALTSRDYLETIIDNEDSSRPPFWAFWKSIKGKEVYIKVKIRSKVTNKIFCVSFHYPRYPLKRRPYN